MLREVSFCLLSRKVCFSLLEGHFSLKQQAGQALSNKKPIHKFGTTCLIAIWIKPIRHLLAQRRRELVSAAPLFLTENGHSWLLCRAKPPARRATFIYAHSGAFVPVFKSKWGLFFLPCALVKQYRDDGAAIRLNTRLWAAAIVNWAPYRHHPQNPPTSLSNAHSLLLYLVCTKCNSIPLSRYNATSREYRKLPLPAKKLFL